jgi:hypothetical protein
MTRQPLKYELHELEHALLCQAQNDKGFACNLHAYTLELYVKPFTNNYDGGKCYKHPLISDGVQRRQNRN